MSVWQAEKEAFEAVAQIGSYEALSDEERNRYDDALRNYRDSVAVFEAAKEEGDHSRAKKVALSLIQQGFANEMIVNTTELPIAEVEKLREQYESE